MCDLCANAGYLMQDVGTATIPDYIEVRCRCNPEPTDADAPDCRFPVYDDFGQPGETPDCAFDPTPPDPSDHWLPASLLA